MTDLSRFHKIQEMIEGASKVWLLIDRDREVEGVFDSPEAAKIAQTYWKMLREKMTIEPRHILSRKLARLRYRHVSYRAGAKESKEGGAE